jgi:TetR/AcrR family transcriptional regulator, transcriptional repressor for nem operon
MPSGPKSHPDEGARQKILDTAIEQFRRHGYASTTLNDICSIAGLTKGALFHYFPTKKALGQAAAAEWAASTSRLFASADYHEEDTPTGRIFAYLRFRKALISADPLSYSCLAGTLAQETFSQEPEVCGACAAPIFDHSETLVEDIASALRDVGRNHPGSAEALAQFTQVAIQGGFVLAKAAGSPEPAIRALDCLEQLFRTHFANPEQAAAHINRTTETKDN